MDPDQDCMEGLVKYLRCFAVKHPVRKEQYVVEHCHGAIGSHSEKMDVFFIVLFHCSLDIHVVRAVYGSTGFDSVLIHNSFIIKKIIVITLPADFTVFAFLGVDEYGCFHSLLCSFMAQSHDHVTHGGRITFSEIATGLNKISVPPGGRPPYMDGVKKTPCCSFAWDKQLSKHPKMMIRRKDLSPDELANLLPELSENELSDGELSCSHLDFEEYIRLNESDCKKLEESVDEIDSIPVNPDLYIYMSLK
ncbi:hypothetical protein TNCV_441641 [Trichonephila clavipes]|nr:hypothetical protein TNCV_441641 [Trichonephila clavipes]